MTGVENPMSIAITFLGHSGFLLESTAHRVIIDPFLTDNPVAVHKPADLDCGAIILTHGHSDHVGDTVAIAQRTGATVHGVFELCNHLATQGLKEDQLMAGNPGGKIATDFGYVAFTQAFHSSSHEGTYTGQPCGIIVRFEQQNFTFHHCGDTALFSDMKLIGEIYRPDVSAIPVGDRFTMGPELGRRAAEFIKPKVAIPVHYATWPLLTSDISTFTPQGVEVKALKPGERWDWRE